ncbi:MAG: alpha/beta fold hydrolase [Bdellovibrionales bacterium]|nr:alpha/beta hydrolase [Bdellovibrionales bacterium]NQZ18793.1 alpha/beta fold hydrolase [Bdellovibrionales bacterium]
MKALYFTDGKAPLILKTFVRLTSGTLSRITPKLFTKVSLKFFMNPKGKRVYQFENLNPERHSVKGVHGDIQAYFFKGGEKHILLTHGWADMSKSFETLITELLDKGFSVWSFDHAGHGYSEGYISNLFAFIDGLKNTILYIQTKDLELHGIISHSMGGAAVLNLNKSYLSHKKVVLMAPPVRFFEAMFNTFKNIGITARVLTHLLDSISQYYGGDWQKIKPYDQKDKIHEGFLIVHDENMIELISGTQAELYATEGLGHRRILKDPKVLSKVSQFLSKE